MCRRRRSEVTYEAGEQLLQCNNGFLDLLHMDDRFVDAQQHIFSGGTLQRITPLRLLQTSSRQSIAARCDSTDFTSPQGCNSNQEPVHSGQRWLSNLWPSSTSGSKDSFSCRAAPAESDVHLPGVGGGDDGGISGNGSGGNGGSGDAAGSGDEEEFLGTVEVSMSGHSS